MKKKRRRGRRGRSRSIETGSRGRGVSLLPFPRHVYCCCLYAISLGRCSLFPSRVGLRTYQHASNGFWFDCYDLFHGNTVTFHNGPRKNVSICPILALSLQKSGPGFRNHPRTATATSSLLQFPTKQCGWSSSPSDNNATQCAVWGGALSCCWNKQLIWAAEPKEARLPTAQWRGSGNCCSWLVAKV